VNIGLSLIPLFLVMLATGVPIRATILFLPVSVVLLSMFALGIALLLSTFAVYFPDVAEMYQIALTAWMYLTPIIYPEEILPQAARPWILGLNPMYHLVSMFRLPLYDGSLPSLGEFAIAAGVATVTLVIGWLAFTERMDEFAYRV
jgi:ABC-type polysaccharide/polyol phosphate export permease